MVLLTLESNAKETLLTVHTVKQKPRIPTGSTKLAKMAMSAVLKTNAFIAGGAIAELIAVHTAVAIEQRGRTRTINHIGRIKNEKGIFSVIDLIRQARMGVLFKRVCRPRNSPPELQELLHKQPFKIKTLTE
jgi:hypothetical protein